MADTMELVKSRVSDIDSRIRELKQQNEGIIGDASGYNKDGSLFVDTGARKTFRGNLDEIKSLGEEKKMLLTQQGVDNFLRGDVGDAPGGGQGNGSVALSAGAQGELAKGHPLGGKTVGEAFVESPQFKELRGGRSGYTMKEPFELKMADLGQLWVPAENKDVYSDLGSSPTGIPHGFGTVQRDPMVPRPQRRTRVRDLFPVQNTDSTVIEFFRVMGFAGGNQAAPVPQREDDGGGNQVFGLKPQTSLDFTSEAVTVRNIAHFEVAHRNTLADEPALRGIVDNELLYGLRLVEDDQILNGDGTGENLTGILNDGGIQSYLWSSGDAGPPADNKADAIRRAMTLSILAFFEPTGVVVHDSDWEDLELLKDENGQYLLATSIALGGEPRVWRTPVVPTAAISSGTALVGSFGLGAQLYDREEANIRVAEQHADFFVRNAIVILAEQRLALAIKRPESFVQVTFDAEPTSV